MCCERVVIFCNFQRRGQQKLWDSRYNQIMENFYRKLPFHLIFWISGILVWMVRISEIQQLSEFPKTLQGNFRGVWGEYLESSQSNDICREPCMALVGDLPNTRSRRLLFSWHMVCIVLQPHSEQFVVNQLSFISVPRIYNIIIFYYIDTSVLLNKQDDLRS